MIRWQKKYLKTSLILSALSGFSILIVDNLLVKEGTFGLESHPILDEVKFIHYLATPLLLIGLGIILSNHILPGVQGKKTARKKSGFIMIAVFTMLIFSGQSLFYITEDNMKEIFEWLHIILGTLVLISFFKHSSTRK